VAADPELPTHAHAQSRDTDSSVHGNSAPVQRVDHHDHGSKATAQLAIIIASISLGMLVATLFLVHILYTEVRLANLHLADMKAAMLAHGINPNPHMPGESP
jgi:hypothetical protein